MAAEKAEKKKDEGKDAGHGDEKKAAKGGIMALLTKLPVLLGGAMVIEAVVLLVGVKLLSGGPAATEAAEVSLEHGEEGAHGEADAHGEAPKADAGHGEAPKDAHGEPAKDGAAPAAEKIDPKKPYEVAIVEFKAPNKKSGRTFLYDVSIYAVVKGKKKQELENAIRDRGALLKDRIRTIIAQSDPEKLGAAEPGLETLRRQVKYQLEEIVGEGIVDEVLVPRCIPFRTDF
jgi:flagellar basal body-associated protein FliL